jgi:hypothetical protein
MQGSVHYRFDLFGGQGTGTQAMGRIFRQSPGSLFLKALRHCTTVGRLAFKTLAIARMRKFSAANSQMRARRTVL